MKPPLEEVHSAHETIIYSSYVFVVYFDYNHSIPAEPNQTGVHMGVWKMWPRLAAFVKQGTYSFSKETRSNSYLCCFLKILFSVALPPIKMLLASVDSWIFFSLRQEIVQPHFVLVSIEFWYIPKGNFLGAILFPGIVLSCIRLRYAELIRSGRGTDTVMALWNFLRRGSMVTIGLTDPPWTIISSTISSSIGCTLKPTFTFFTSDLEIGNT